jgi:GNAT superfamily N-acetyltransferase
MPDSDEIAFEGLLLAQRRGLEAIVEEVVPLEIGFALRTRSLPRVWTLNQVCVAEPASSDAVVAVAEAQQADLAFRHVVVNHGPTAAALIEPLGGAGWRVDRLLFMLLGDDPAPPADRSGVVELSEDEMLPLMRRWLKEELPASTDHELDDVAAYNRLEGRRWDEVVYGIRDPDGAALAVTKLRHDGRLWWVEDVYTVPAARGRGYARALVTHAVEVARADAPEVVFIVADADDWPQHLYASIGFRPIGTTHIFHLDRAG